MLLRDWDAPGPSLYAVHTRGGPQGPGLDLRVVSSSVGDVLAFLQQFDDIDVSRIDEIKLVQFDLLVTSEVTPGGQAS